MSDTIHAHMTKAGRELAHRLGVDATLGFDGIRLCSLIARHEKTYRRVSEYECNGDPVRSLIRANTPREEAHRLDALATEREKANSERGDRLAQRIADLVAMLGEGFSADCQGDPRGAVVRIHTPDKRDDGWGGVAV